MHTQVATKRQSSPPREINRESYLALRSSWQNELLENASAPENAKRAEVVAKAFETEVASAKCLGYHGCSIRALISGIKTGYLPSGLDKLAGLFYVAPSPYIDSSLQFAAKRSSRSAIQDASGYAFGNTSRDLVAGLLGRPYGDPLASKLWNSYNDDAVRDMGPLLKEANLTLQELDAVIQQAEGRVHRGRGGSSESDRRQGVVLALSLDIQDSPLTVGKGDFDDLKIVAPEGIQFGHLVAVEPLGDFEYEVLVALQKRVLSVHPNKALEALTPVPR